MQKKIVMNSGFVQNAPARLKTVYMARGEIVKTNSGTSLEEAGPNCLRHLQRNDYAASYAEVLDADTDQMLYCASVKLKDGKLRVTGTYEWSPEDTNTRFGVSSMFEKKKGK